MHLIIYPKYDWIAAEAALNVQTLASGRGIKVYPVPKHYGRDTNLIKDFISKAQSAIVFAYERNALDRSTIWEIEQLKNAGKFLIFLLPNTFKKEQINRILKGYRNAKVYFYDRKSYDFNSVRKTIMKLLKEIDLGKMAHIHESEKHIRKDGRRDLLIILGIIFLLLLMSKEDG